DDAEDDLAGVQQRLAVGDHVPNARGRADQFGHDHIGPGPAQHQSQNLGDLGRGTRNQHPLDDARRRGAERVGGFDQVTPRCAHAHRHHQHNLKHRADENHQHFLQLANARPQNQQGDKGRGGQIAAKGHKGFEEGFHPFVRAHRNAQRHGDQAGQNEAGQHPPNRHGDVGGKIE
ncbi:MAG: hypothetical protein AN485_23860, partial [Anabaena sp. MDT14b]